MRWRTFGIIGEADQVLDHLLPGVVRGVRFAGNDQLDGVLLVQQQGLEPFRFAQHQGQPLVGGHTPGEADGQDVRIQHGVRPGELGVRSTALLPGRAEPAPDVLHERGTHFAAQAPRRRRR